MYILEKIDKYLKEAEDSVDGGAEKTLVNDIIALLNSLSDESLNDDQMSLKNHILSVIKTEENDEDEDDEVTSEENDEDEDEDDEVTSEENDEDEIIDTIDLDDDEDEDDDSIEESKKK